MKYLLFSDLHGSLKMTEYIIDLFEKEKCDKMIFLGDLLYHGPRNSLPDSYNPKEVASLIKQYQNKIIFIKGNCDAEVDEMIIEAKEPFFLSYTLIMKNKNIHFVHGHHLDKYDNCYEKNDIVIYGHNHIFEISIVNDVTFINIGSLSLPKDNIPGYAILNDNEIILYDINNQIINSYKINE